MVLYRYITEDISHKSYEPVGHPYGFIQVHNIVEKLRDNGTKYIAIAYDADKAKNINVLNAEKAFATEILNAGFGCIIVNWDAESGKGMDDAIINKSQFQFSEITKENIENYYCPWYANLEKG